MVIVMDADFLYRFLLWCLVTNYVILLVWFFAIVFARGVVKNLHGRWFKLSDESFDTVHYGGMAIYKIGILLFNLSPLLALYLMGRSS